MILTLRIFFYGLLAFVPGKQNDEMTVLILDTRKDTLASDHCSIHAHRPLIMMAVEGCVPNCPTDGDATGIPLDKIDGRFLPLREDIEFKLPANAHPHFKIEGGSPREGQQFPSNRGEADDFWWIGEMGLVSSKAGKVDVRTLGDNPPEKVLARVKLSSGLIRSCQLARLDSMHRSRIHSFLFKPLVSGVPQGKYSQALADVAVLELEVSDIDYVDLVRTTFGGQASVTKLIGQDCGMQHKCIDVFVTNVPPVSPIVPDACHPHEIAKHFEAYYDLSEVEVGWRQRPVPHATRRHKKASSLENGCSSPLVGCLPFHDNCPQITGFNRPICPMTVFDPSN